MYFCLFCVQVRKFCEKKCIAKKASQYVVTHATVAWVIKTFPIGTSNSMACNPALIISPQVQLGLLFHLLCLSISNPLPGSHLTNDVSIEFQIRPKFEVLWFEMYSTNHNETLHTWCVHNFVVIGWEYFKLQHSKFLSNFEFDWNYISGTGARWVYRYIGKAHYRHRDLACFVFINPDVMTWKCFICDGNIPIKGQWCEALIFYL